MTDCPATSATQPAVLSPTALVALLSLGLGIDQLLLWRFLGLMPTWMMAFAAAIVSIPVLLLWRVPSSPTPAGMFGWRTAVVTVAVGAIVLLLGGEGRLFYANTDWQVRNAVLRDLTQYPWPFTYDVRAEPDLLRAPIGMYLLPALIGKALGYHAAEWALMLRNTIVFALILLLGAQLFETTRARVIALAVFLCFSGMDLIGQLLASQPLLASSERWSVAIFSAHVTQAFAVPQHALAGWAGAAAFLLWRTGRLPLVGLLFLLPWLALWSPLALMGIMPFAVFAGLKTLVRRWLRPIDIALPLATCLIAVPGLLYLASGSATVGGGVTPITLSQYTIFELLEVAPYLLGLALVGQATRFGRSTLMLTAAVLLAAPLAQVGDSSDFVMRASIPALAILALMVADALAQPAQDQRSPWRGIMIGALSIGVATPVFDVVRAVVYPPAPQVACSYFGVVPGGFPTYVTPLSQVDRHVAPTHAARIRPNDPPRCWTGKWPNPIYRDFPERVAPEDWDERI